MAEERNCPHCGKPVPTTALQGICPECMLKAGLVTQTEAGRTGSPGTKVVQPPPQPAEIAALFPQLEILEFLGRGGMGMVYKARQPKLGRFVALKILARDKESDSKFAERFTREAQALAQLNHPNIVTVYDFGETDGLCYLLMEFVDGLSLRQLLQAGKMEPEQALVIVPKICEALQFAHEHGIVHRDIKPENILLDKTGRVKIADFGIARMVGGNRALTPIRSHPTGEGGAAGAGLGEGEGALTEAGNIIGTPHYMAPEQVEKPHSVDHRVDIYSLGVVFYEMLTGELPLGRFQPPSQKVQVDVRLDEVVLKALEKEPERRYQQASVLKTAVETIAQTQGPHSNSRMPHERPPARKDWIIWSPFQSPEVREICARMTDTEKMDATKRAMFWGLWCAVTSFALVFSVAFLRGPALWYVVVAMAIVQAVAIPTWQRMQRQFLCSTAWARERALTPEQLRLFSFAFGRGRSNAKPDISMDVASSPRCSRAGIWGAVWAALFFVNWMISYTPPGWALTGMLRDSIGRVVTGLFFSGPMAVLGFAAPLGATALGVMALRQIHRSRGTLCGFFLALLDTILFPLLLLNRWMVWLASEVVSQVSLPGPGAGTSMGPPRWVVAVIVVSFVALNGIAISAAWGIAKRFFHTPPPPVRPLAGGTWAVALRKAVVRLVLVVLVQLALVETLQQVSLHWKESTGEQWAMALAVSSLAGLVWVFWPRFRLRGSWLIFGAAIVVSGGLLLGIDALYLGYLRPNLGLYRESDWVVQNVGFQIGRRQGIARHLWRRKVVAPSFEPVTETFLMLPDENKCQLVDLDTGKRESWNRFDENAQDTPGRLRADKLDLMAGMRDGHLTVLGFGLGTAPVSDYHWDKDTPQNVADYFLLEWQPPKPSSILWPLAEHWQFERNSPKPWIPQWMLTNTTATFYFRTGEGGMGLMQIAPAPSGAGEVAIRYRLVRRDTSVPAQRSEEESFDRRISGWFRAGSHPDEYDMARDPTVTHGGKASACLKCVVPKPSGFGTLMQTFKADSYRGQRVRLSGFIRSEQVRDWAGFWVRVDGQNDQVLAFDNMQDRAVKGTADWMRYEIVLDVPEPSQSISMGLLLAGSGLVWMDDLKFEVVGKEIPVTGGNPAQRVPRSPQLDFTR